MFSLQNLFHKPDKLLLLLESSALQARASVQALADVQSGRTAVATAADETAYSRHKDKDITQQISKAVYETFIAAIEREDVEELSSKLYKIPKLSQKFIERYQSLPELVRDVNFVPQITALNEGAGLVVEMICSLQKGLDLDRIKQLNDKLQQIENDADQKMLALYRDLYNGNRPVLQILALKDLYELLEKIIDRCRDVGNIVTHIVLKNS